MKQPVQMNGQSEWGSGPKQPNRFYSVLGGVCVLTPRGSRMSMNILEVYEKEQ